jgi:xanthine dehydrogenase accessory factor
MLVDDGGTSGTIGGGRLEWQATAAARRLLHDRGAVRLDERVLGPELGQCCGGRVELWLERLTRDDLGWLRAAAALLRPGGTRVARSVTLTTTSADGAVSHRLRRSLSGSGVRLQRAGSGGMTLFETWGARRPALWICGAGHVGQALVRLLSELALFDITWLDPRPELLPGGLPECVTPLCAAPVERLAAAPAGALFVVLTHDHALDYELCRTILERGDFSWLGLIGSASKAARFRSRLLRAGVAPANLARLTCPIGVDGITSKLPAGIAIAVAAQLLRLTAAQQPARPGDAAGCTAGGAAGCSACGPGHGAPA